MTSKLLNYLTIILFLVPFTLLIVDGNSFFPFITTKAITFRILVTFGLALAAWLYLLNPNSFPKKNYLFLATVLFFFANILATIFSVNPYRSFWGNAERMEGLWSLFFYLSYFFLLFTLFQFKPEAKKIIFYSILIVTTSISLIELNQAFILKAERPSATLGNPTYIGFLNLLTIFLILYFLFEELRNKENLSIKIFLKQLTENIFLKAILIILIFLNLLSLLASQTRGSILGLLAGIFAFIVFYLLFSKTSYQKKILIFTLILLFLVGFFFFLRTPLALEIPGIKRIAETLQNPQSIFPRLFAWKIFFNAFLSRPIFGYGPETMPIAFFKNLDLRIYQYEQAIFDRPHNKFIEVLASTGIVGFISWLLIFVAFMYYLLRENNINFLQKSSLFAFIIAYLTQNFSLFDMQASYLLFFFGLSLITPRVEIKQKDLFIRPYLILVFGLTISLLIFHFQHFYIVRKIISNIRQPDPDVAIDEFLKLSEIAGPFLSEYADMTSEYLFNNMTKIKNFKTFSELFAIVETAYQKDPLDYKLTINYLNLLLTLIDAKKQVGLDVRQLFSKAENVLDNLIDIYPNNYEIYPLYVKLLIDEGKKEKAKKILQQGEKHSVYFPQYLLLESSLYLDLNENQMALRKLNQALEKNFKPKTDKEFLMVLRVYLANGDVENSKKIISDWLRENNSTSTKEIITQILKEYNHQELLKLDK